MKRFFALILLAAFAFSLTASAEEEVKEEPKWYDMVEFMGDFRYRFEMIDTEGADARYRNRIRARFGFDASLLKELNVVFQLATGSADPVSTNQTLDGGFSTKAIWLDLGYLDYHPGGMFKGVHLLGGKMKNPFMVVGKSELMWDSDLRPEGMAVKYSHDLNALNLFANGAGFWVEERSSARDSWLIGMQAGGKYKFFESLMHTKIAFGYFNYTSLMGNATIFDNTDPFGNTVDAGGLYVNDYNMLEIAGEVGAKLMDIPLSVFGDFIKNVADNSWNDIAWLVGFMVGKAKKPMSFDFRYNYREIEADAVLAVFSDSDFIGGGTDGKGHEFAIGWQLAKHVKFAVDYFYNKQGVVAGTDFHRLMLDLKLSI